MQVESIEVIWNTFKEKLPKRNVWILVTPPKDGLLSVDRTTLMANADNMDFKDQYGYHFFYHRQCRYLKSSLEWKWCYESDIKTNLVEG